MKQKTEHSLLKWASLLCNKQLTSIIDIENTSTLIKLLNVLEPFTFQELYQIDQRSSNSVLSILKAIDKYFKRQLKCNVSSMIENLNIFKSPMTVWQLLIGVAIKGRNRDANINVILQMQLQEQSELMLLVEDIIEKLNQFEIKKSQNMSELSSSSEQNSKRNRNKSKIPNEIINQIVEQNQSLKQKIYELQSQMSQQKSSHQRMKKNYEDRLNQLKNQRYQFLEALTGGSSGIESAVMRSRKNSRFQFRDSLHSSTQSKIFDDPLHDLNISITGSLPEIATDMLNAVKNLKKELSLQQQKASLFEDHLKDLKLSFNPLIEENKFLKSEVQKALKLQKQCQTLKSENDQLLKNETQMIKIISQVEQQKNYLREMVEKLKQEKNQLVLGFQKKQGFGINSLKDQDSKSKNNMLDPNFRGSNERIDMVRAPSMILRQMGSELQPQSFNLNDEIEKIKNPLIQQKYEKTINELREKNNILRQQNNELKQMNKMLQKTVHKSMQKSEEIQKNIQQGYKALFSIKSQIEQSPIPSISIKEPHENHQKSQQIKNIYEEQIKGKKEQNEKDKTLDQKQKDNKIVEFYEQVKKIVESYEQKQMLMMIEIQSLKKQLSDVIVQKENIVKQKQKVTQNEENRKTDTKTKKELKLKNNLIEHKLQIKDDHKSQKTEKIMLTDGNQQKIENNQQIENSQEKVGKKQDSVIMFNINISTQGGQNSQVYSTQDYKMRRSDLQQKEPQKIKFNEQKRTKNKQNFPSQEFIEIQQGQQFNENDLPIRKSHENSQISDKEDEGKQIQDQNGDQQQNKFVPEFLNVDFMNGQNRLSTVSGIGFRLTKDDRKSYFSRSGFYNESFLQVSNKLQQQIQTDLDEIKFQIKTHTISEKQHKDVLFKQSINDDVIENEEQILQNQQLIKKLDRIKQSYEKIRQFHNKSTNQLESQLKQQLSIESSQLTQLKIKNQQLKQSLTLMVAEKQNIQKKLQQMKETLKNANLGNNNTQSLHSKFSEMLSEISQLQTIMPLIQASLQESKVKQLQVLYNKQKQLNTRLNQQIEMLLQTIVYFRNLAISEEDQIE